MIIEQTFFDTDNNIRVVSKIDSETLKKEGVTTHYDKDGLKLSEITYKNDVMEGMCRLYHEDKIEDTYFENNKPKHTRFFAREGKTFIKKEIITELFYDSLNILSKKLVYNPNGSISEIHEYDKDKTVIKYNDQHLIQIIKNKCVCTISHTPDWVEKRYVVTDQKTGEVYYVENLDTDELISKKYNISAQNDPETNSYVIEFNDSKIWLDIETKTIIKKFVDKRNSIIYTFGIEGKVVRPLTMETPKYLYDYGNTDVLVLEKNIKLNFENLNFLSKIALLLKGVNVWSIKKEISEIDPMNISWVELEDIFRVLETYVNYKNAVIGVYKQNI